MCGAVVASGFSRASWTGKEDLVPSRAMACNGGVREKMMRVDPDSRKAVTKAGSSQGARHNLFVELACLENGLCRSF